MIGKLLRIFVLMFLLLIISACEEAPTPTPGEVINMGNVCKFGGQVMEVEGRLILPRDVTCTVEEPLTCRLYLEDPFTYNTIPFDMPVSNMEREIPVNFMAELPESYALNDFYIHTADGRWARDRSLVSVRGKVVGASGDRCSFTQVESVTWLKGLLVAGMDISRLTLQEAISEGVVVASITGNGLSQITLTLKPEVEVNLEIEVVPGTTFISSEKGVQNMIVRQEEMIYLKPNVEISVELQVSCANMELKQPGFSDVFTVSNEPVNEDLQKLLALEEFLFHTIELQQFAIWTITDNPYYSYYYTPIEVGGYSHTPLDYQVEMIKDLFIEAGIDTVKYWVFQN